jgi:hypothetical protein
MGVSMNGLGQENASARTIPAEADAVACEEGP